MENSRALNSRHLRPLAALAIAGGLWACGETDDILFEDLPPEVRQLVTFHDDFSGPNMWEVSLRFETNGASTTAQTISTGGNPDGYRYIEHDLPAAPSPDQPTQIAVDHWFTGGTYDPRTQGAIKAIGYAEDHIVYDPAFPGAAIGSALIIEQGGQTFTVLVEEGSFNGVTWDRTLMLIDNPQDFSGGVAPDFSENGGPMRFGVLRSNTTRNPNGIVAKTGLDNWAVAVVPVGVEIPAEYRP